MAGATVNFGGVTLGGGMATFGGQLTPIANYANPLARKFVYKEKNKIVYPLRKHMFRLKVRTAAELRIHELTKQFMLQKAEGKYGVCGMTATNNFEFDHMGSIVPKDEYEVKKYTAYLTSKKNSQDYKEAIQEIWTKVLFLCESNNHVGKLETISHQLSKPATDEEFMAWFWYAAGGTTTFAFIVTFVYWWYKFGQQLSYAEIK